MSSRLRQLLWRVVQSLLLGVAFVPAVPLLALGTSYWSPGKLFDDALPTASYSSSLAAFAVAILGGHFVASLTTGVLWWWVVKPDRDGSAAERTTDEPVTPAVVGALERAMYVYVLYLGVRELIAVWLALKAVGRWQTSERIQFNIFLVGTLLSVAFGLAGAAIVAGNPLR